MGAPSLTQPTQTLNMQISHSTLLTTMDDHQQEASEQRPESFQQTRNKLEGKTFRPRMSKQFLNYQNLLCPVFEMEIEGIITLWLLDTGAAKSIVTPQFIKTFKDIQISDTSVTCKGANNQDIPLKGEITLKIQISEETHNFLFQVSECQIQNLDGIIGMDILTKLTSWNIGGSLRKGAYLQLNNDFMCLKSFLCKNSDYDKDLYHIMPKPLENKMDFHTTMWHRQFMINASEGYADDATHNCASTQWSEFITPANQDDKNCSQEYLLQMPTTKNYDKKHMETLPPNSIDSEISNKVDKIDPAPSNRTSWRHEPCSFGGRGGYNPSSYNETSSSCHDGKRWAPRYNTLFRNCQNNVFSNHYTDDHEISKFPIYAQEATNLKTGGCITLKVRADYTLQNGPVIFTPSYDLQDQQLNNLAVTDTCSKRATLKIFNNSSISH